MEYYNLIIAYSFYVIATVGTPGANNIMIAASGANFGIKRSIPHVLGIRFGAIFMMIIVGLGLGQVFVYYPIIHDILRYVGASFLLYLAYKIATSKKIDNKTGYVGTPLTFIQAALFQWVNPKAWVMNFGAIAAFIAVDGDKFIELSILITVNFVVGLPLILGWCLFGREVGKLLKSDRAFMIFNYFMGGLLFVTVLLIL